MLASQLVSEIASQLCLCWQVTFFKSAIQEDRGVTSNGYVMSQTGKSHLKICLLMHMMVTSPNTIACKDANGAFKAAYNAIYL